MKNSEKYRFSDFTFDKFEKYISLAKKRFTFKNYENYTGTTDFIIWRHDVDYSMHKASKLAAIESDLGISSTYFLHLHNDFYSLLELEITNCVKKIIGSNHNIGLHFETEYYENSISNEQELEEYLLFEKRLLERIFNVEIKAFSFHNPGISKLDFGESEYAGMVNAYSNYFRNDVSYCSDSFGIWRYESLGSVLVDKNVKTLQVLTHPELWSKKVQSPKERIWSCIEGRDKKSKSKYKKLLKNYHQRLIDW